MGNWSPPSSCARDGVQAPAVLGAIGGAPPSAAQRRLALRAYPTSRRRCKDDDEGPRKSLPRLHLAGEDAAQPLSRARWAAHAGPTRLGRYRAHA